MRTPLTLTKGSSAPHADADEFVLMEASNILTAVYAHRPTRCTTLVMQLAQSTTKRLLRPAQATKTQNAWHIFVHQYCTLQTDTTSLLVPDYYHVNTYSITHTCLVHSVPTRIAHTHTTLHQVTSINSICLEVEDPRSTFHYCFWVFLFVGDGQEYDYTREDARE